MSNEIESTRQQKIGRQILRDISDILSKEAASLVKGTMVSVTRVRMSPDFSLAKAFSRSNGTKRSCRPSLTTIG